MRDLGDTRELDHQVQFHPTGVTDDVLGRTGNQATSGPWSSIAAARGLVAAILDPRSRDAISEAEISYRARPMIHPVPGGG